MAMNSTVKFETAQEVMQDLHHVHFLQIVFTAGSEEKNA
jgi:hypothetical protein